MFPADLRYTSEHLWVRIEGEVARIGITSVTAEELGDITEVELPEPDETILKDDLLCTVEGTSGAVNLSAPLSGRVRRINPGLERSREKLTADPYSEGWLLEITMSAPEELSDLLDIEEYASFVAALSGSTPDPGA